MLRWKLVVLKTDPLMGNFASSKITEEERYREKYFGQIVRLNETSSLEEMSESDIAHSAKAVFEVFNLKNIMEVDGAEKVNIFCCEPYISVTISLDGDGRIMIGSGVAFSFNQEQFETLLEFADILKKNGLLYRE